MNELVPTSGNQVAAKLPEQTTLDALDKRMEEFRNLTLRKSAVSSFNGLPERELLPKLDAAIAESPALVRDVTEALRPATKAEIAMHLSALMKSVPYDGGKGDSDFFGRQLIEDIGSLQPSITGLMLACRDIRRKSNFIPSIAEIINHLEEAESKLKNTLVRVEWLAKDRDQIAASIAESDRMARLKADRAAR